MENFETDAKRLEEKIMGLFEKAMSSPEERFEVFESLGGVTLRLPFMTDPNQIVPRGAGYEILEGIAGKVLDGKWKAIIEEDISGKCRICIIDYVGRDCSLGEMGWEPCPSCGKNEFISDFDFTQHWASCVRFR